MSERTARPVRGHPVVAVMGGTFDGLHAGHRRLLEAAFGAADQVGIGLTTAAYLKAHPKSLGRRIAPYTTRRRRLAAYLRRTFPGGRWWIVPLEEGWGRSVEPGYDVLVASVETRKGARSVNVERLRRGLPPLKLILIPLVRGDDHLPIASRRIRSARIDLAGRRRAPLRLGVATVGRIGELERELPRLWPQIPLRISRRRSTATRALTAAGRALEGNEFGFGLIAPSGRGGRTRWALVGEDGSHISGSFAGPPAGVDWADPIVAAVRRRWAS